MAVTLQSLAKDMEDFTKELSAVKDCGVKGHQWCVSVRVGGECTLLGYVCERCRVETSSWLHDNNHRKLQELLAHGLKGGDSPRGH